MKYFTNISIFLLLLTACQGTGQKKNQQLNDSSLVSVGGEKDQHGCLVAAGYTWSKVKEDCIRPWEGTITMNVTDTSSDFETAAFALIGKQKAEIFLKEEVESILLDSVSPQLYTDQHYQLQQQDHCWALIHQDEVRYQEKK